MPAREANGASPVDFDRPFASVTFEDGNAKTVPQQNVDPKVVLLELGILLLEIWHEKTLETQFSLRETPVKYHDRLALALQLLDDISDPLLDLYARAVSDCMTGIVSGRFRFQE